MKTFNKGYLYLAGFLILDALFPILSFFVMKSIPTLWLITFSVGVSILFGLGIFFKQKLFKQYKNKDILLPTFLSALFLGMGGVLYFFGIKYSSPSIAAILLLLQTFFAFILFNVFGNEKCHRKQIIGAILMLLGCVFTLYDGDGNFINLGAGIMVLAAIAWTLGNYYTKKASLKGANPFFLLINRHIFMIIVTGSLAFYFVGKPDFTLIKDNFIWISLIGFFILLLGKALWIISLSKLSSFVAISAESTIIPLLVLILSFFILNDIPSSQNLLGFTPIIVGSFLLIKEY